MDHRQNDPLFVEAKMAQKLFGTYLPNEAVEEYQPQSRGPHFKEAVEPSAALWLTGGTLRRIDMRGAEQDIPQLNAMRSQGRG